MPEILPGYRFNQEASRYASQTTGRFVARNEIVGLLDKQVAASQDKIGGLTRAFHEGSISQSAWLEQMRTELKSQHLTNRALGAGGWDRLTQRDFGAVGGRLRADYRRLEGFANDIASGKISLAQAYNRSNMYAGNARIQFWEAERAGKATGKPGMVTLEHRTLGVAEHCVSCIEYADMGWQPLDTLPPPGADSECMTNCRCQMDYKEVSASEAADLIDG